MNGYLNNWLRLCWAVDGFRSRYGRWPKRVRMMPVSYTELVSHVLTPVGFALVSSVVELVPEDEATMIADDGSGAEHNYGCDGTGECDPPALVWFGQAVLRPDPGKW